MRSPINDLATTQALTQPSEETPRPPPFDWEKLAKFLIAVNYGPGALKDSGTVSRHVSAIHRKVGEKEAEFVANFFNRHRSDWLQKFLG